MAPFVPLVDIGRCPDRQVEDWFGLGGGERRVRSALEKRREQIAGQLRQRALQPEAGLINKRNQSIEHLLMSEKDPKDQASGEDPGKASGSAGKAVSGDKSKSREDRLAEALRANLRRRKSAAKTRKPE